MVLEIKVTEAGKAVNCKVTLPESWNEVPVDIYPYLASLFLKEEDEMPVYDKQVRTFSLLAEKAWPAIERLVPEELYELLKLVDWVYEKFDLVKNMQPVIGIDGDIYQGPADDLANLRWGEWVFADTNFVQYARTKEVGYLDNLIATIYRPAGIGAEFDPGSTNYRGDNREKFNGNNLASRLQVISKLPFIEKQGIYLFFMSCRWQLILAHPHVFPQPKPGEKPKKQNKEGYDFGWMGVHDDLCGEKGRSPDQLEEEFLSTILLSLERSQIKWKQYKSEK